MKRFVESEDRTQITLLRECLDEHVAEGKPVRIVEVFVDEPGLGKHGLEGMDPAVTDRPTSHPSVLQIHVRATSIASSPAGAWSARHSANVGLMRSTQRLTPDFKAIAREDRVRIGIGQRVLFVALVLHGLEANAATRRAGDTDKVFRATLAARIRRVERTNAARFIG